MRPAQERNQAESLFGPSTVGAHPRQPAVQESHALGGRGWGRFGGLPLPA